MYMQVPNSDWIPLRALVDSGCDINLIRQDIVLRHELRAKSDKKVPNARFLNDHPMTMHKAHQLQIRVDDASSPRPKTREWKQTFFAGQFTAYDVILGNDWCYVADVQLRFNPPAFTYGDNPLAGKDAVIVDPDLHAFINHIDNGEQAYIAYCDMPTDFQGFGIDMPEDHMEDPRSKTRRAVAQTGPYYQRLRSLCEGIPDLDQLPNQVFQTLIATLLDEGVPDQYSQYSDVFSDELAGTLAPNSEYDHAIDLEPGQHPPHMPIYNLSERELGILKEYLASALEKGWIRPSKSPAGAPILFVPKKDGSMRMCIDYRGLNKITVKNRFPLPLISELLDRLSHAKIFSKLDLRDAYHRLRIKEGDEWKTAFRTRYGHYEYRVMPFGLTNAPATFQSYIHQALGGLLDTICVVYLDDILIFSHFEEEHIEHVSMILERLRTWKLYAKRSKCTFHTTTTDFLGFVVSPYGVHMDPARVQSILEWPEPESYRDVQVFLGFANFYRRFIHDYSALARPLNDLIKAAQQEGAKSGKKKDLKFLKREWEWPEDASAAFRTLRGAFTQAPVLRHFDPALPCMVISDASDAARAAILLQPQEDAVNGAQPQTHWHPVAYYSLSFKGPELRYEIHDKELLAIVDAFKVWRHYLEGARHTVRVITDHNNLKYFMTTKVLNGRQARWAEKLAAYDFQIEYKKGESNPADGPSRRPDYFKGFKEETIVANRSLMLPTLQQKLEVKGQPFAATTAEAEVALRCAKSTLRERSPAPGGTSLVAPAITRRAARITDDESESDSSDSTDGNARSRTSPGPQPDSHDENGSLARSPLAQSLVPRSDASAAAEGESSWTEDPPEQLTEFIKSVQDRDPFVAEHKARLASSDPDGNDWQFDQNGLLRCQGRVWIPRCEPLKLEILRRNHDDDVGGHYGTKRTTNILRMKYEWAKMRDDIQQYIKTCDVCQRSKARRHKPYGVLHPIAPPSEPHRDFSMDFITDLPPIVQDGKVYDSVLVVIDRFSKHVRYIPTSKTVDAQGLAQLIYSEVTLNTGPPRSIISDRGTVFTSEYWQTICYELNVRRRMSTAFHPQTDGQTERQNQELENYLRVYCTYHQDNWLPLLKIAAYAYNSSFHESTKAQPLHLHTGVTPDVMDGVPENALGEGETAPSGDPAELRDPAPADERALEHLERTKAARTKARDLMMHAQDLQAKHYNKKRTDQSYAVGDKVLLSGKNLRTLRPSRKLSSKYLGPFEILSRKGKAAYTLALPASMSRTHPTFHVSLLEPYFSRAGAQPEVVPEMDEDGTEADSHYEIEEIVDHKTQSGTTLYRIKWLGYGPEENSWLAADELDNAETTVNEYWERTKAVEQSREGVEMPRKRGQSSVKKPRGRPKGSKNKPKT